MVAFPFNEDLLQFIWEAQLFDHRALTTTEGAPLDVIKAGRLHGDSGPDLLDARVRINDQLWAGNIEVHIKSSEWYAHGHETDAAYDNVVLHVVYEHDMEVRTAGGSRVTTVELKSRIKPESIEAYQRLMHAKAWVPCASQFDHVDKDRAFLSCSFYHSS